ncbi:hypothetical protein, partial [Mucilaginibacter sp. 10I4]|uniref:hypothetical protein n=1 Tax=Mucilaginibacter sp. 10I4 TaxID=3048580 RepID=UPI002B230355
IKHCERTQDGDEEKRFIKTAHSVFHLSGSNTEITAMNRQTPLQDNTDQTHADRPSQLAQEVKRTGTLRDKTVINSAHRTQ